MTDGAACRNRLTVRAAAIERVNRLNERTALSTETSLLRARIVWARILQAMLKPSLPVLILVQIDEGLG